MSTATPNRADFPPVTIEEIRQAREFLKSIVNRTPLKRCPKAFEIPGTELFLKFENEQLTGSFKIRGAMNKMNSLTAEERKRGVVASSAGNHAQGVAYAAQALGVKAHIVMPVSAPIVKVNATKSYGAEVILHGDMYDDAFAHAKELEREKGYVFTHAYQDPMVIAGQGTIGLEIFEELPDVDTVVVPIGGGGLISGIAIALKTLRPSVRVIGVVSNQAPGMMHMYRKDSEIQAAKKKKIATIADGIAVKTPSPLMYETYISKYVDEVVSVDDNEIAQAIVFLLEKSKTVTEGSGAAALAAIMSRELNFGKKACVVLSGGNIDMNVVAQVIERGLRREHRLARLAVVVDDLPGNLNVITSVMANLRANILEVYHDRVSPELGLRETRIDLLVETSSDEHIAKITEALKAEGFKVLTAR